jgi:hypothetical protein
LPERQGCPDWVSFFNGGGFGNLSLRCQHVGKGRNDGNCSIRIDCRKQFSEFVFVVFFVFFGVIAPFWDL